MAINEIAQGTLTNSIPKANYKEVTLKSRDLEKLRLACKSLYFACENIRISPVYIDIVKRRPLFVVYLSEKDRC
jgi:hypothetical protein